MLEGRPGSVRDPALRLRAAALALAAAAGLLGASLVWPQLAGAHGIIQRANLPLPEWLFAWAAGVVLVVSFLALAVLWPEPKLERDRWRPLPGRLGLVPWRPVEVVCGLIGVLLLAVVIASALFGTESPLNNFAPSFIFIIFWVGMVFVSAVFGDVFPAFSPWRALGRLFRLSGARSYPERLGNWPAAAGLLAFTWIELASEWGEDPRALGLAVIAYTVATLVAQAVYGTEAWTRNGEAFAVYFGLFARISPFERRDDVLGVRPLLAGLPRLDPKPGTVALLMVMIGTVTFDGLSGGQLWKDVTGEAALDFPRLVATIGMVFGVALVSAFYALGVAGARSVGGDRDAAELRRAFIHSLVPIAMVYVAAHYLTFLLFEGQSIQYLVSDPLGEGWDLFGTATSAIDYGVISQNQAWYLQVGFVVVGHVAALVLAHDRALALYPGSKIAVRSQYWMLGVMVGFTTLALWLLAAAQG